MRRITRANPPSPPRSISSRMVKMVKQQAKGSAESRGELRPRELDVLLRYDWIVLRGSANGLTMYRAVEEILHAVAYALLSKDAKILRELCSAAVASMESKLESVGAVWNDDLHRYERGPYGIVNGGPVHDAHAQTQEIDAIVVCAERAVRNAERRRAAGNQVTTHDLAFDIAMKVIANIVTQVTPTLYRLVPGREDAQPQQHVIRRKDAAARAVRDVLERSERSRWSSQEINLKIVRAALRALGIPSRAVKAACDSVTKRRRRRAGGQKK